MVGGFMVAITCGAALGVNGGGQLKMAILFVICGALNLCDDLGCGLGNIGFGSVGVGDGSGKEFGNDGFEFGYVVGQGGHGFL
ncbi:hypothetical protein CTI12_AA314600 [Artemisia annua]|uniref:Uncharacterized protein n=1 Tax=Artemisia annua TaxID=35608 RepID=A0A2U1N2T5_ARTAN|nr:hypothetical protein CTI12_AA583360 [Artemisia annua]PWA67807.1 hypothetical protein CTI12_AA314580 [Artemisia annua]PWA67808.1 hypothetical protein CTI12_AA314590 [Artemisia annua]PWA67809.1 hypothetical protein CTI12_AA314600 [Artemisia annua]